MLVGPFSTPAELRHLSRLTAFVHDTTAHYNNAHGRLDTLLFYMHRLQSLAVEEHIAFGGSVSRLLHLTTLILSETEVAAAHLVPLTRLQHLRLNFCSPLPESAASEQTVLLPCLRRLTLRGYQHNWFRGRFGGLLKLRRLLIDSNSCEAPFVSPLGPLAHLILQDGPLEVLEFPAATWLTLRSLCRALSAQSIHALILNNPAFRTLRALEFDACHPEKVDINAEAHSWATVLALLPHLEVVVMRGSRSHDPDRYIKPLEAAYRLAERSEPMCVRYNEYEGGGHRHSAACALCSRRFRDEERGDLDPFEWL